jgi:uncharacterized OB-fold protein
VADEQLSDLGPVARVDELSAETAPGVVYDRFLADGILAYQRCLDCGQAVFHPRVLCRFCGSDSMRWHRSAGRGTVYAVTTLHPRDEAAYNVSLVDIDEGFRMMSNVIGIEPSEVRIGVRVRLEIQQVGDEPLPLFRPEERR